MSKLIVKGNTVLGTKEETITVLETQAEYDSLSESDKKSGSYLIKDASATALSASQILYDTETSIKDKIDATNNSLSQLQSKIKSSTFNATTEAGTGNIPIGSAANIIIIASVVSNGGITSYPFIYGANNLWYVHCMDTSGVALTTATSVSGTVYYLEK